MSSPRVTGASDHNGRDAQTVSAWLMARGITAPAYTGQSEGREELEQALLENDVSHPTTQAILLLTAPLIVGRAAGSETAAAPHSVRAARSTPTRDGAPTGGLPERRRRRAAARVCGHRGCRSDAASAGEGLFAESGSSTLE